MRAKRAKQYRKLMQQYSQTFGFREPYQVLVDADVVRDAHEIKMGLVGALERTLLGKVKPMITQCSIRHLYAEKNEQGKDKMIALAQSFERRRCGHHPSEYPEPLSAEECLRSVIDPKDRGVNKHCYVVACQSPDIRRIMRSIKGVPLIHIKRAVMVMEPMADESVEVRRREEKNKFRAGLRGTGEKRRRAEDSDKEEEANANVDVEAGAEAKGNASQEDKPKKKKKKWGEKGPNPLSVKKKKKKPPTESVPPKKVIPIKAAEPTDPATKKKRKRSHRKSEDGGEQPAGSKPVAAAEG